MKIPVVLPTVCVKVEFDGTLAVDVDGEPHDTDCALRRGDLRTALEEITTALGTAVRVEVQEADGTTYADIVTPPDPSQPDAPQTVAVSGPGINGSGFEPGEEIAIGYVFAQRAADELGTASLHLPPALLAARRERLVLFGLTSRVIATLE